MKIKKTIKLLPLLIVCVIILASFTSCSDDDPFLNWLGFDTHDYEIESVVNVLASDSDTAQNLVNATRILSMQSPELTTFTSSKKASTLYRDSILRYMLSDSYAKYAGNIELLDKASAAYPQLGITIVIPADDYENTVYRYFGGNAKVRNASGKMFTYLDRINAYTTSVSAYDSKVVVTVVSCEETAKTYRLTFCNTLGSVTSPQYRAIFIKRDDGTFFYYNLKKV